MELFATLPSVVRRAAGMSVILLLALVSQDAKAEIYAYTGNYLTDGYISDNAIREPFPQFDFISGFFTVPTPLAANLNMASIDPESFFLGDQSVEGYGSLNPTASLGELEVSTDSSGAITQWAFIVSGGPLFNGFNVEFRQSSVSTLNFFHFVSDDALLVSCVVSTAPVNCPSNDVSYVSVSNDYSAGFWTESASPTPEPSLLVPMSIGLLVLAFVARKPISQHMRRPTNVAR